MRKIAVVGAVLACVGVSGCAIVPLGIAAGITAMTLQEQERQKQAKVPVSNLNLAYRVEGGKPIGLIRAFDDGQRLVLQFITDPPEGLTVVDSRGTKLTMERRGQNVLLAARYIPVFVSLDSHQAAVKATGPETFATPFRQ